MEEKRLCRFCCSGPLAPEARATCCETMHGDDVYCCDVCCEHDDACRPIMVTLCGSTRFYDAFQEANYRETIEGRIVLSVGFFMHSTEAVHGGKLHCTDAEKVDLDILHKKKIDLSDEVLVLNVGGYIGESTRSEIEHATKKGKAIRYLEPLADSSHRVTKEAR